MTSIFPLLLPNLQTKIAQYALLTHRAAVLAAMPVVPAGKGRPTHWPTQPAPVLLQSVVHYAGQPRAAKLGRVLLRAWFQKKTELREAVYSALDEAGYPLPTLTPDLAPSPWHARLVPEDTRREGEMTFFYPAGQPVPDAADASPEEITLMAHLLGWSVLVPVVGETPPEAPTLHVVAEAHHLLLVFREVLHRLSERMPPALAEVVARGELPDEVAPYWHDDWATMRNVLSGMRTVLQEALHEPETSAEALLTLDEFHALVQRLETVGTNEYLAVRQREAALVLLTRVERLRHRHQPDFAPLAALRERTAATRAAFEAEWPLDEAARAATPLTTERVHELLALADVYRPLLRLANRPAELAHIDETSEDYQRLEAAVPSGVLNALLLRKLVEG